MGNDKTEKVMALFADLARANEEVKRAKDEFNAANRRQCEVENRRNDLVKKLAAEGVKIPENWNAG